MFLSSFEGLRKFIIENYHIENMLHLGPRTFDELSGEVVQNTAFVLQNTKPNNTGTYYRLVDGGNSTAKHQMFLNAENRFSNISQDNFEKIPGSPIAYWVSEKISSVFENNDSLNNISPARIGMMSTDNVKFTRQWSEVDLLNIGFSFNDRIEAAASEYKWFPYNKGGTFRKWYGNNDLIVNWQKGGRDIAKTGMNSFRGKDFYFKEGITWGFVAANNFGVRYKTNGFIFDIGGSSSFPENNLFHVIAFLNTKLCFYFLNVLNPTMNFQGGNINSLPFNKTSFDNNIIEYLTKQNISLSKSDWDSRETSWDFEKHPLIKTEQSTLQSAYQAWEAQVTADFYQLHANETELNRIFIDIYGLQDELTPEVKLRDITILQEELNSNALGDATEPIGTLPIRQEVVMRQLISYLVGCLMGRYRLDKPGLHIAHPATTADETVAYTYNGHNIEIDDDGIIPLMDNSSSFADNALIRIKHLLEAQWGGDKQLIETINYLQAALGKDLETYLVKDFWKDHCSRYQKRPIYWLFASPKGAFQVITYMHRMNKYTVEKIRSNYLLVHIRNLENQYSALKANDANLTRDEAKRMEKIEKDLIECRDYDLLLKDMADRQISFDLDDGVVVNYAKFESVVAPIK